MADLAAFCGACPSIGTCPDCVRERLRQNNEDDIAVCCSLQSPSSFVFSSSTRELPSPSLAGGSNTRSQDPSTTRTSTTLDSNNRDQSSTFLSHTSPSISSSPSPTTADPSSETPIDLSTTKSDKSLNITAIAIGVTGAALLLIVCATMIFYLRKKRQRNRVPPSAEFMNVVAIRRPRAYHETASPTSSMFTPKDGMSFASSPYEPTRCSLPPLTYSPPPTAPHWSS